MPRKPKKRQRRLVVDTSVLVSGISGFKENYTPGRNPSADILHQWAEEHNFLWLVSEDIFDESKDVLSRLRVRSHLIGRIVNLIRERAEELGFVPRWRFPGTQETIRFVFALSGAKPTSSSLSIHATFRKFG